MIALSILCNLFWLIWLLPFLLGALLWWLCNRKYNSTISGYENKVSNLNARLSTLNGDLQASVARKAELEGDLSITKGRMREMEGEMTTLQSSLTAAQGQKSKVEALSVDLNRANDEIVSLKSSLTSAKTDGAKAKDLEGKLAKANDEITSLKKSLADADTHKEKADELSGKLAKAKEEIGTLNSALAAEKSKTESISAKAADTGELDNLKSEVTGLKDENARLRASLDDTKAKLASNANMGGGAANVVSALAGAAVGQKMGGNDDAGDSGQPKPAAKKSIYSGIKSDNLQIVEGIGPKMESVLKENGVHTHQDLSAKSPDELRSILAKYGDKYKIIDPTTWAQQAGYAADGDYEGLIDLQKRLDTGRDNAAGMTDSKLEKWMIKNGLLKAFKQDDLKAIEGIGPATEKLLHNNGIKTWRELANTKADALKKILADAGSRFSLGDPTTWPKQAEMAADGKFDELREYQDFLDGGKE